MNLLDMRTVIYGFSLSNLICLIVMFVMWKQNGRRYKGMGLWLVDFILQFLGMLLIALREMVPDLFSMVISNTMILGGTAIVYQGLEAFTNRRGLRLHNFILLAVFVFIQVYFVYVYPSLRARNILISAMVFVFSARCAWLLLAQVGPGWRAITRGVGTVFAVYCFVSVVRILIDIVSPPGNDFFNSGFYETLLLLTYQMLFIMLTFSLLLMVNSHLVSRMKDDISARVQAERILEIRIVLWEYSALHSVNELMQKALDEIELLTGSKIGFYHFVEEETKSLTLQSWSTRTRNEFCRAEGEGMHYAIDKAGVWVDCVRERRPIIHNDYESLPHKKGMPQGHAKLVRELVVPTMRENRVVSVLGVGNKAVDYTPKDIELVAYIADLVWTIVVQKSADDKIRHLNGQLEHLAMTDELTGLPNRRSFFIQGGEEIKRSQRYKLPLSLIMIDIDNFKNINDNFGHEAGDKALKCVANTIGSSIRDVDVGARLGGEEFGILLPNTGSAEALVLAERLRRSVEESRCMVNEKKLAVTASIGVAAFIDDMPDLDTLLRNADMAMYQAKRQGRNQVVSFHEFAG